jgi:hypothetical protein
MATKKYQNEKYQKKIIADITISNKKATSSRSRRNRDS